MNLSPPPTFITEASQPGAGTFDLGSSLPATGSSLLPLIIFGALLFAAGVAVMWLRAYHSIRRGNGLTPLRHDGETNTETWVRVLHQCEAEGKYGHDAEDAATQRLGWKPGDRP